MKFNAIIVGAGVAGSVMANRLANEGKTVLLLDKRHHIAGNCFDEYDENHLLIHRYGPHIFHTDNEEVWSYLSQFTEWIPYQHKVLGFIDGQLVPVPFNLNSIEQLFPKEFAAQLISDLIKEFGFGQKISILKLLETQNQTFKFLADYVYEKIFYHYTKKQWGKDPKELDPTIFHRVPVFISRDDRYFQDKYQGLPKLGYTRLFEKMVDHPNIHLMLNTDAKQIIHMNNETKKIFAFGEEFTGQVIYTGTLDDLFNYELGGLPYRTLKFELETHSTASYQDAAVVNYPNNYAFTRITEYKKLTQQSHLHTVIAKEYPFEYEKANSDHIPYYPVFSKENQALYETYLNMAKQFSNLTVLGRLAEYKYYDIDDMVARVLIY